MCGILGHLSYSNIVSPSEFNESLDLITHRGPDDFGTEYFDDNGIFFYQGFRRLSIIDLSEAGHQPMGFDNLSITFNGEVYNYQEIKEKLLINNYDFISNSDTEVILKAIHFWGVEQAVKQFNGMFSIAIFNSTTQELSLIRDRIGIKPLYYYWDNKSFVYSSEVKPILAFKNTDKTFDNSRINTFLSNGYVPAPNTVFKNIKLVEAGSILTLKNTKLSTKKYWSLTKEFASRELLNLSDNEIKQGLDEVINSSVKYRMISDVPIGSFLSGGIDSSLVSAIMQKNSNTPINTFSIGFNETKYNEATFAKEISDYIGSNHHELYLSMDDAKTMIPEMINNFDIPFGDSSAIPMMLVSKLAKSKVTVALSGDGGDELFCGYKLYDQALRFQKFQTLSKIAKPFRNIYTNSKLGLSNFKYLNLLYADSNEAIINSGNFVINLFLKDLVFDSKAEVDENFLKNSNDSKNIQEANMLLNMKTYLPDDILKKVDISSMAISLEARVPLLDHRVLEYSFSVPHNLKYNNGDKKYILKELLYDYIPKELLDRPKKGFSVPIFDWLHGDLFYLIEQSIDKEFVEQQGVFNYTVLQNIVNIFEKQPKNYYVNNIIWNYVVFQLWYKKNIQ